jgi:hypothetical protein
MFEGILMTILGDPTLDGTPLIKVAVRLMQRVVGTNFYPDKMMALFQRVFEPTEGEQNSRSDQRRRSTICGEDEPRTAPVEEEGNDSDGTVTTNWSTTPVVPLPPPPPPPPRALTVDEVTQLKEKVFDITVIKIRNNFIISYLLSLIIADVPVSNATISTRTAARKCHPN